MPRDPIARPAASGASGPATSPLAGFAPFVRPRWRPLPHTADRALRVGAPDYPTLVAHCVLAVSDAAWGLASLEPREAVRIAVPPGDPEMQLFRALSEALFLQDARDLLAARAIARPRADGGLDLDLSCDRLDPARHRARAAFKAVTFHGMHVRRTRAGLSVRIVMDV